MACIDLQNLRKVINDEDWDQLLEDVKPIYFITKESEELPDASILAQICLTLINENAPIIVKVLCLKCLANTLLPYDCYKHKSHTLENTESDKYSKNMYNELAENDLYDHKKNCSYPHNFYFPYDGVLKWTVDYVIACGKPTDCLADNRSDMFRVSIRFLCNSFTYACPNGISADDSILKYLDCDTLKQIIVDSTSSSDSFLASTASVYVHNALKNLHSDYFMHHRKVLCQQLLKLAKEGSMSAKDALPLLLHQPDTFENVYSSIAGNEKLELLAFFYHELRTSWETSHDVILTRDQAEFLALTFCERSDLILKTVDTYVNSIEPREITFILDILGLLTSTKYKILTNAKRLLINCKYLLMSLHMIGKDADNYFTPITSLSKMIPDSQAKTTELSSGNDNNTLDTTTTKYNDPQDHPAFGFKARLIQVIANMVYEDRICQDLFREIDGIPLLLDCCNIDARNPFIPQWSIFALRNLCEGNLENQQIIRDCKKEGVLDSPVLQEMGLTLHEDDEDGKSIRIAPLRRI